MPAINWLDRFFIAPRTSIGGGDALPLRSTVDYSGDGVSGVDDEGGDATRITIDGGRVALKTWPSDANYTAAAAERAASIIVLSGGALSATRNLVVPLTTTHGWWVVNGTSGGHSIQVIGATGTGITIATTKTAFVFSDGTNIRRASADV